MLKRKILKDLLYWKNNHRNNCLMVIGARQVGKTYIIKKFAEENYENFAYYSCSIFNTCCGGKENSFSTIR